MGAVGPLAGIGPAARACLSAGLLDCPTSLDPSALADEVAMLLSESMAPVALAVAERMDGTAPDLVAHLRQVTIEMQVRAMGAELAARRVLSALQRRRIEAAVIKGPAVAPWHPDGWPRAYSDIDLLVPSDRFDQVIEICHDEGFTEPASTPPWPWMDAACKEGVNLHCSRDGGNMDVHHHVPPWVFGTRLTPERVLAASGWGEMVGHPVRLAAPEHSLVIAALHVLNDLWKGRIGLVSWRDIVVLLPQVGGDRAEAAFEEVGLGWLLTLVTASLAEALPEVPLPPLVAPRPMPLAVRGRIAALGWNSDSTLTHHRVTFAARLPIGKAAMFVAGCVVPQPRYVREYYGSYAKYWRHLLGETVSTVQGADPRMDSVHMTKLEQ